MTIKQQDHTVFTPVFLRDLPRKPGVYLMKNRQDVVLYVGKARDLRNRVSSYARPAESQPVKTAALLKNVTAVETILTATEKEALILESSLIKKFRPRYNVILRDDKSYPYIKVTVQEEWPRFLMTRGRKQDGARYFGPYASPSAMWTVLHLLRKIFPLRRCKGRELKSRKRPCLNFQIKECLAPCAGLADRDKYQNMVGLVIDFLEGKNSSLLGKLENEMHRASHNLAYEEAGRCRDSIKALQKTLEKQIVVSGQYKNQDVFGLARQDLSVALACLQIRKGVIIGQQTFYLAQPMGEDPEVISQAIEGFYDNDHPLPSEILVPVYPDSSSLLAEILSEKKGTAVKIRKPQRGDGLSLLSMATANAGEVLAEREKKERSWKIFSKELQYSLQLSTMPDRIECLDISNLAGEQAVGSLVVFSHGESDKGAYRHYRIKNVAGPDDYAMMDEVLERRFSGKKIETLPDLLLLDGGKGQLNTALNAIKKAGLEDRFTLLGIAKDRNGAGERIFAVNRKNPLSLKQNSPVLLFLMRIRDEAHRFGITFHRKLRRKNTLRSSLDDIPGIGPARRKALLLAFGSLKEIARATASEIAKVHSIGPELAEIIHSTLQKK